MGGAPLDPHPHPFVMWGRRGGKGAGKGTLSPANTPQQRGASGRSSLQTSPCKGGGKKERGEFLVAVASPPANTPLVGGVSGRSPLSPLARGGMGAGGKLWRLSPIQRRIPLPRKHPSAGRGEWEELP